MFTNVGVDLLAIRGLNQIISLFRLFLFLCSFRALYFRFIFLYPLYFEAFSYSGLAELETCSLEELLDNLSSMEFGRCFIIWGGWFEEVWIYRKLSFGFLQGLFVLFARLNVTFKKFTIFKLASISILKPLSLNNFITFFLILSVNCAFVFRSNIRPSSRYQPMSSCGERFESCDKIEIPVSLQISARSLLPIMTSKQPSNSFFLHASSSQ